MKGYKLKFSTSVIVLLILLMCISVVGMYFNVTDLINAFALQTTAITKISRIALTVLNVAVLAFSVSLLFSRYSVKGKFLTVRFGFFKDKTDIFEITEIVHFNKSDKLVIYLKNAKFSVIIISPENYDKFVADIRTVNASIVYLNKTEE